jgi:hypothetical protein
VTTLLIIGALIVAIPLSIIIGLLVLFVIMGA